MSTLQCPWLLPDPGICFEDVIAGQSFLREHGCYSRIEKVPPFGYVCEIVVRHGFDCQHRDVLRGSFKATPVNALNSAIQTALVYWRSPA